MDDCVEVGCELPLLEEGVDGGFTATVMAPAKVAVGVAVMEPLAPVDSGRP